MAEEKTEAMPGKQPDKPTPAEAKAAAAGGEKHAKAAKPDERERAAKLSPKQKVAVDEQGSMTYQLFLYLSYEVIDVPWWDWILMWDFLDGVVNLDAEY